MRINRYLSRSGFGSRRSVEKLVREKRVYVNGNMVSNLSTQVQELNDVVEVDGKMVAYPNRNVYYKLNKPVGVVSTTRPQNDEVIVTDFVPSSPQTYPVGRLDKDSRGLILLTNDGELTHSLTHPRRHISKSYEVTVKGETPTRCINQLRQGVAIGNYITQPAEVVVISANSRQTVLFFVLHEGKYRQIRRMCASIGLIVIDLKRVAIGPLLLGDIPEGQATEISKSELNELFEIVGLLDQRRGFV